MVIFTDNLISSHLIFLKIDNYKVQILANKLLTIVQSGVRKKCIFNHKSKLKKNEGFLNNNWRNDMTRLLLPVFLKMIYI